MNYFFLYNIADGKIYGPPYLGEAEEWTNIPQGCGVAGPISQDDMVASDAFMNPAHYVVKDKVITPVGNISDLQLFAYKQNKIDVLRDICNASILSGFESSVSGDTLLYGFSYEDQQNLSGMLTLMNADTSITNVDWKPKGLSPINLTKAQFLKLCKDSFVHKQANISKYWSLKEQVENANTKDDIDALDW